MPVTILLADDDPVMRLARAALAPAEVDPAWLRAYFAPDPGDPSARLAALARRTGLDHDVRVLPGATGSEAELLERVAEADAVVLRRGRVSAAVLGRARRLRLVQRIGARPHGIDLEAAARAGVTVSCLPRRTLALTAEHVFLLMLALAKRLLRAHTAVVEGRYDPAAVRPIGNVAYNWPGLTELDGLWRRTLGIIGLGEVGTLVARRARAFDMTVLYHGRTRLAEAEERRLGVRFAPLDELLAESDFVSLHASDTPENEGLMGEAQFARMKPTAVFVNTSRGRLCDEAALLDALRTGRIGGAGLDVHQVEPRPAGDPLAQLPNVVLTPHAAGGSRYGLLAEIEEALGNVRAALDGRPVAFTVRSEGEHGHG